MDKRGAIDNRRYLNGPWTRALFDGRAAIVLWTFAQALKQGQ